MGIFLWAKVMKFAGKVTKMSLVTMIGKLRLVVWLLNFCYGRGGGNFQAGRPKYRNDGLMKGDALDREISLLWRNNWYTC